MLSDIINIGLGFLEGFALIISPCILPILPTILAGSLDGSKKRPVGIVIGFVVVFALFTFFSRKLVQYSGIDLLLVRHISYVILFLFGIVMLSRFLTEKFSMLTQSLARVGSSLSFEGGFFSGVVLGGVVGLLWTPCAGPILAAVIVQTVIQKTGFVSFLIVLAFGLGAAIPMLAIAMLGRNMMAKLSVFKQHAVFFRKLLGVIIIASVGYMIYSESAISLSTQTEGKAVEKNKLIDGVASPYTAPSIEGISEWINSSPIQLSQLEGKVVLIDFWTYSCINCVRTLPYIKDWYNKYHDKGLEIIGVHSPEFEFEKDFSNVKNAVLKDGIQYPVALDNAFTTWQNYHNRYWPAHYLIDKNGKVVYEHFGEGDYDTTENNIRFLLGLNEMASAKVENEIDNTDMTPETYLGYSRMENNANSEHLLHDKISHYLFPTHLARDAWALQGDWKVAAQEIVSAQSNAALKIHFNARKVFIVMGNATGSPIQVKVLLNGKVVEAEKGKDVASSLIIVKKHDLYEIIALPHSMDGVIELTASAPGLAMYAFTFG